MPTRSESGWAALGASRALGALRPQTPKCRLRPAAVTRPRFVIEFARRPKMDELELLRTVPIFSELTEDDIQALSKLALRKRYPKDSVVFFENEEGDFFFMIL